MKNLTLFVSADGMATYYQWLKADYGFKDSQVRPYTFNPQPFLVNQKSAMQGYVTSEPFAVEKAAKFTPKVFLLADQGFSAYSTLIETRRDLVDKKPDLVQRFVDASIIGWYNYIYHDNAAANALIKKQNPEMTDDLLAYSVAKMKEYGIVDSGDATTLGVGAMTDARMKDFFDEMVRAGVTKADLDYRKSYTLQFVDKKVGLDLRPKHRCGAPRGRQMQPLRSVVALRGVGKTFPSGTVALAGLDLDVRAGEFVSLLGPSGCGKSTALRIIAGLSEPTQGAVEWRPRRSDRQRDRIGFVFQEPTLMPWAPVFNNVLLPLKLKGVAARATRQNASTRRSIASACKNSPAPIRANCPAACACASRSRARWSPSRRCC